MTPRDILNLVGAAIGGVGFVITALDLWPEVRLHRARQAMARAKALLEIPFVMQQGELLKRGEIGSDYGTPFDILHAQFVSRMVRGYGLTDEIANQICALLDVADKTLPKKTEGAHFIVSPERFTEKVLTQQDYLRMVGDRGSPLLRDRRALSGSRDELPHEASPLPWVRPWDDRRFLRLHYLGLAHLSGDSPQSFR